MTRAGGQHYDDDSTMTTDGEFPFKSFTMRSEGYDRNEVDQYVGELQREIAQLRRSRDTESSIAGDDARLHDPEGAVTRTLAIAQETADRVLHDAQIEADRRRTEADEHATTVIADADTRASRLLGDMEAQAAEVREQGVAAARSAIQVERDKAMAELAQVRRVRDDLRVEASDLKSSLDHYRSQAREASDTLAAASSGPLMAVELPDFIDDDVVLAGMETSPAVVDSDLDTETDEAFDDTPAEPLLAVVDEVPETDSELAEVISIETDSADDEDDSTFLSEVSAPDDTTISASEADPVFEADSVFETAVAPDEDDADEDGLGGTFLAEVRAAAEDDDIVLAPESAGSDRFLSELRGLNEEMPDGLDSEAADRFFDDQA